MRFTHEQVNKLCHECWTESDLGREYIDTRHLTDELNKLAAQPVVREPKAQQPFNEKWHLVSSDKKVDGILKDDLKREVSYQLPGESLMTCNALAWYAQAVYWKHRALAGQPVVREPQDGCLQCGSKLHTSCNYVS